MHVLQLLLLWNQVRDMMRHTNHGNEPRLGVQATLRGPGRPFSFHEQQIELSAVLMVI